MAPGVIYGGAPPCRAAGASLPGAYQVIGFSAERPPIRLHRLAARELGELVLEVPPCLSGRVNLWLLRLRVTPPLLPGPPRARAPAAGARPKKTGLSSRLRIDHC
jgi:hypothetical protein